MSHAANYHRWIIEEMQPFLGRRLVEVGAGIGDLTELLLKTTNSEIVAFEPSPDLFARLSSRLGECQTVSLVNDVLNRDYLDDQPDTVIYINVLEHIEKDQAEIRLVSEILQTGGTLVIFVPALSWLFSEEDSRLGHFRRYHKRDLVNLVQGVGLKTVTVRYFDIFGVLPWYVNFVLLKNSFDRRAVSIYDRLIVPPMKVAERLLPPPIGKNLFLVARKT